MAGRCRGTLASRHCRTVGTASDIVFDPSGDLTFFSKYVTLWLRQPDGKFLYTADSGNAAPGR